MSKLVELDPDVYQDPEHKDQKYGHFVSEQLPNVSVVQNVLPKAKADGN